jgi:hypothetical protein
MKCLWSSGKLLALFYNRKSLKCQVGLMWGKDVSSIIKRQVIFVKGYSHDRAWVRFGGVFKVFLVLGGVCGKSTPELFAYALESSRCNNLFLQTAYNIGHA